MALLLSNRERQTGDPRRPTLLPRLAPLWVALACLLPLPPTRAQAPPDDTINYTRERVFKIPFQSDTGRSRLKEVQLYVSTDMGHTWHPYASAPPDQGYFKFTADRDAYFWFSVRTVDTEGVAHPVVMDGARPGLKVCVDTQPPVVDLRPLPAHDGMVGVAWDVRRRPGNRGARCRA